LHLVGSLYEIYTADSLMQLITETVQYELYVSGQFD